MRGVPELLHQVLPRLRQAKGLTQEALARATAREGDAGISNATVQKYERPGRAGAVPEVEILDALGRALGVDPAEAFYEYPIAAARRAARPGTSQRRVKPPDVIRAELEEAARLRRRRQRRSEPDSDNSGPTDPGT